MTVQARAIVVAEADLRGAISIGSGAYWFLLGMASHAGTVVHPRAKIDASVAPIQLGDNCIVEEGAELVSAAGGMTIGDGNLFRVGCHVASPSIGNCNTFEVRCRVPASVRVSNFCTVGASCDLGEAVDDMLEERTVVYGEHAARRIWSGENVAQQLAFHAKHLQYLRESLPQTHKLRMIR